MRDELITLTVYFSGTAMKISSQSNLVGYLFANTPAEGLQQKKGFDGCGITHGDFWGGLFGYGTEEQAQEAYQHVLSLLKEGKRVRLNCFGHSRGGVSALLLAKMLGDYPKDQVEVNLALADPVPGNIPFQVRNDPLSTTLAKKAMDLSNCKSLNRVLTLYTHDSMLETEELLRLFAYGHTPVLPQYPKRTFLKEVVVPGSHSEVLFVKPWKVKGPGKVLEIPSSQVYINVMLFVRFLTECGTQFIFNPAAILTLPWIESDKPDVHTGMDLRNLTNMDSSTKQHQEAHSILFKAYEDARANIEIGNERVRVCHSTSPTSIVADPTQYYLNSQHRALAEEFRSSVPTRSAQSQLAIDGVAISITPPRPARAPREDVDYSSLETMNLFKSFLKALESGMSDATADSVKGVIMRRYIHQAEQMHKFDDQAQLSTALRNVLALALQCTRIGASSSYASQTGMAALKLFKSQSFAVLGNIIMGSCTNSPSYSDLRQFVIGKGPEKYFASSNSKRLYACLEKSNYSLITAHPFIAYSFGNKESSSSTVVNEDFKIQKLKVASIVAQYISSHKLSIFCHRHNQRAIVVKTAILACTTLEEIQLIIQNQQALFNPTTPDNLPSTPLLRGRWADKDKIHNDPKIGSGYVAILDKADQFLAGSQRSSTFSVSNRR